MKVIDNVSKPVECCQMCYYMERWASCVLRTFFISKLIQVSKVDVWKYAHAISFYYKSRKAWCKM